MSDSGKTHKSSLRPAGPSSKGQHNAEFLALYHTRLRQFCIMGMIAVPVLYYLEVAFSWASQAGGDLLHFLAARAVLEVMFVAFYLYLRGKNRPFAVLRLIDWTSFVFACVVSIYIGVLLNGIDTAFFCGIIMMNYLRAFLIPGGLRLALPILLVTWLSLPVQILCMAAVFPDVAAQLGDRLRVANAVLNFLLVLGVSWVAGMGAYMMDRLQRQSFRLQRIGRYQVLRKLGEGGMGVVYLARHGVLKRPTAIKLLRTEKPVADEARRRFEREALHTAQLAHPNTIQIFDFGVTDDNTLYYAMEYVEGLDVSGLVSRSGPLPAGRAVYLGVQVCRSLGHAHRHGIVHRDIKPANCIVSGLAGQPDFLKVLDFGLAKMVDLGSASGDSNTVEASQINSIKGTPAFMSPEQCLGNPVDARSDIYSLGCVLYFMLTGAPTFQEDTWIRMVVAHANQMPLLLSEVVPGVSQDLERVVMRCLAKSPDERYQSAEDVETALLACQDAKTWSDRDAVRWWTSQAKSAQEWLSSAEIAEMSVETTCCQPLDALPTEGLLLDRPARE